MALIQDKYYLKNIFLSYSLDPLMVFIKGTDYFQVETIFFFYLGD